MGQQVAVGIAGGALLVALLLVVNLVRLRRRNPQSWGVPESLTALGLVVTVALAAVSFISSQEAEEDPAVTSYRNRVVATCSSLKSTSNALMDAMDGTGFDRDRLQRALRTQVDGSAAVLAGLWAVPVPPDLTTQRQAAKSAGAAYLKVLRSEIAGMSSLPKTLSFADVSVFLGQFEAAVRPSTSTFDAAMTDLAGRQCLPTPAGTGG